MNPNAKKAVHFVLAMAILGGSAAYMQAANRRGGMQVVKKALPIRKPLRQFNHAALAPFEVILDQPLREEALEEVGTNEHLDYVVVPRGGGRHSRINLTVFYYTGKQDQIPHVPEECLYQGGGSLAGDVTLKNTHLPKSNRDIDLRRVSFNMPGQIGESTRSYYTICVNGKLYSARNSARFEMTSDDSTHMYYAKVEIAMTDLAEKDDKKLDTTATELMDKTLAELFKNHFPLAGWEKGGPPVKG